MSPDKPDDDQRLGARVTSRHVQRVGDGSMGVLCARRLQVVDVLECRPCEHFRGLSLDPAGGAVFARCAWERSLEPGAVGAQARLDCVTTIMSAPPSYVPETADLAAALTLVFERQVEALLVVDGDGRAVGIVTKDDLLRCQNEPRDAAQQTPRVAQVMSHLLFELHCDADISRAAALMAHEGVQHVVVTSTEGHAVGIVSALDVMGWLARTCGYVVTGKHEQPGPTP